MTWNSITGIIPICIVHPNVFGFWHILSWKDNPTLSFWWLFNRIQAKLLVIRYQLSVIGYQLLQQNCSTCFYLLLSVLLIIYIIILYFLTPVILIITPHYNYSATTYHDLACYMMPSYGDLTEKNYLGTLLSQIIYKPIHYGIWIMQFYWPCHAKGAIETAAQWINLKENYLQFWLSDPLSTTVCV